MIRFFGSRWFALLVPVICVAGLAAISLIGPRRETPKYEGDAAAAAPRYAAIPFDGKAAFTYLQDICKIGRRISGSDGMRQQQEMLEKHFTALGAKVERQTFKVRNPLDGSAVELTNLIVVWNPSSRERYLVCAHYDTRPFPDRDPANPQGTFIGANDGASGVAVLMELGKHVGVMKSRKGVDFVLFDGEELVYDESRDRYFLGSEFFAQTYHNQPPEHRYRQGVLLDMVGDARLVIRQEQNSLQGARAVVGDVWAAAARIGVREFEAALGPNVRDDHLPLMQIARIPVCDIIDFDYPYWHTEQDVPANCSADSLEKVGKVVHEWLRVSLLR